MKHTINIILLIILATLFFACKDDPPESCNQEAFIGTFTSTEVKCDGNPKEKRNITFEKTDNPDVYLMSIEEVDTILQVTLNDCTFKFEHELYNEQPLNPSDTTLKDSLFLEIKYHGSGELIENNLSLKFITDYTGQTNNPDIPPPFVNKRTQCDYKANK